MYSRQQASLLRQEFWTAFGQYMLPIHAADGEKINWINYKTGDRNIHFKMEADNGGASISIELAHRDLELQQLYFEEFVSLKSLLHHTLNEEWHWTLHTTDGNGKRISKISTMLTGVSIFKKEDWPALISFFKPRMIALDAFWSLVKYRFEALQ